MKIETSFIDLISTSVRLGQLGTISSALHAFAETHNYSPVRHKMLLDSLALVEAIKDDLRDEVLEGAAILRSAIS